MAANLISDFFGFFFEPLPTCAEIKVGGKSQPYQKKSEKMAEKVTWILSWIILSGDN